MKVKVWIAYREDDAVYQDRSVLGLFTSEAAAKAEADDEARYARDEEEKTLYHDPDDESGDDEWDVDTGVEGPYELELDDQGAAPEAAAPPSTEPQIEFASPNEYIEWHVIDKATNKSIERCDEPDHAFTHWAVEDGHAYVVEATVQARIVKHRIVTEDTFAEDE